MTVTKQDNLLTPEELDAFNKLPSTKIILLAQEKGALFAKDDHVPNPFFAWCVVTGEGSRHDFDGVTHFSSAAFAGALYLKKIGVGFTQLLERN